jgi:antirestriction protein ArdC
LAKPDIYQRVTDRIVGLIEEGQADAHGWIKPWATVAGEGTPSNAVTKRRYRGVNVLLLWGAAMEYDYTHNLWATYRQWKSIGAQVKKKPDDWPKDKPYGSMVVFFKVLEREVDERDEPERIPFLRYTTAFNADQVDGYEKPEVSVDPEWSEDERLDRFMLDTGASFQWGGAQAKYNRGTDRITLPHRDRYPQREAYYGTAFHELAHWTGHERRLARETLLRDRFGLSAEQAMEELVAELSSAFTAARFGIEPQAREDHAHYVANWLQVLKNDTKAVVTAASKAADATDYLCDAADVQTQLEVLNG